MNDDMNMLEDLCVVDPSLAGYDALIAGEQLHSLARQHFATGEEALRSGDFAITALWLVNLRLPDMEGAAFLSLARQRVRRSSVFLIGDRYSPTDEMAARVAGASAYLWKPADEHWMTLCRHAIARAALRKGMQQTLG